MKNRGENMSGFGNYTFERLFGWEQIKREKYISDQVGAAEDRFQITYRSVLEKLPIIRVPIQLPMYRLENGRTVSLQEEYIANSEGELPPDYFRRDKNSVEVQEVQHNLLQRLVKTTELDKYFKNKDHKQTQPLICTKQGFVVNGNRRLSCWRDLFYADTATYSHFRYIDIALLPVDDEDAIEQLESDLQIAPDIKDEYLWHAEAMMMKYQRDEKGKEISDIAKMFRTSSEKDVEELIEMFDYADEYLTKLNMSKRWSKVDDKEWAFRETVTQRKRLASSIDKEVFKGLAFSVVKNSGDDRAYNRIKDTKKYYEPIVNELKKSFPVDESDEKEDQQVVLDILMGGTPESLHSSINSSLLNIVGDMNNAEEISSIIINVIEGEKLLDKEAKSASFIIDQVKKANALLQSAVFADLTRTDLSKGGVGEQLESIQSCVYRLREWLSDESPN